MAVNWLKIFQDKDCFDNGLFNFASYRFLVSSRLLAKSRFVDN